jgi:hypothetical protein
MYHILMQERTIIIVAMGRHSVNGTAATKGHIVNAEQRWNDTNSKTKGL